MKVWKIVGSFIKSNPSDLRPPSFVKEGNNFGEKLKMKEKMNILQFSPYFPPHKGGVETVAEEIADYWTKKGYGKVINITFDVGQVQTTHYSQKGYKVFLLPSFDIISNFPVPKFWKKDFWRVLKELRNYISENKNTRIVSHTRFFLSSFIAGIFARKNKLKWVHIEHGSDYVKLSSKLKSKISYMYDKIIGKWIFQKADTVLAISEACKKFIIKEFIMREVEVFYRGMSFENIQEKNEKKGEIKFVFIGRLVKLKGVEDLIEVYKKGKFSEKLIIIGDGEEREYLEKKSQGLNIEFLGFKDKEFIYKYLQEYNCIVINSSYQEGMPTTILEALMNSCTVIASDVGGTSEISEGEDLVLYEAGNIEQLIEKIQFSLESYDELKGKSFGSVKSKFDREVNIKNLFDKIK